MAYVFHEDKFRQESEAFYSHYPSDVSQLEHILNARYAEEPQASATVQKIWTYELISQKCDVHIFRYCPFYSEVITGRERNSIAGAFPPIPGLGCWTLRSHYPVKEFDEWRAPYVENDLVLAEMMVDHSHHYANVETILKMGFQGVRDLAASMTAKNRQEQEFLTGVLASCDAAILLGERFADKAAEMLKTEENPEVRETLIRIRDTAGNVPRYPAKTFYEALSSVWFTRELCTSLEGSGFAVMGHYDRLLQPFYEQDIQNGCITKEEAQNLIDCMITITDARWEHTAQTSGTNASVVIGGCDAEGNLIFNDVTRMILDTFVRLPLSSPKLQARISIAHPREYKMLLAKVAALGRNCLSVLNDDILIEAHRRAGKELEDCRLYLAGGCQEPVLSNECNSRAFFYINLPQLLNGMLFPEELDFWTREDIIIKPLDEVGSFDEFYSRVIYNFSRFLMACANRYLHFEQLWPEINPMPLFSATMPECIQNKMDITRGGARYNSSSFSLIGIGTFIDALFAIREVVFRQKKLSMAELTNILRTNFVSNELQRLYLNNKIPKFGQDVPEMMEFSGKVFHDLAVHSSGLPNARGGYLEASLFAFFFYDVLKTQTMATADGRLAGQRISRGCNPSESSDQIDTASLLYALRAIDFSDYPGCAVTYLEMPISKKGNDIPSFASVLDAFLHCGGNALDFNVVNMDVLMQAKNDPENHRNLIVRVCGYSAPFISLSEELQDEIIQRTMRTF